MGRHRKIPISAANIAVSELKREEGLIKKMKDDSEMHQSPVIACFPRKINKRKRVFIYDGRGDGMIPTEEEKIMKQQGLVHKESSWQKPIALSKAELEAAMERDDVKFIVAAYVSMLSDDERAISPTS